MASPLPRRVSALSGLRRQHSPSGPRAKEKKPGSVYLIFIFRPTLLAAQYGNSQTTGRGDWIRGWGGVPASAQKIQDRRVLGEDAPGVCEFKIEYDGLKTSHEFYETTTTGLQKFIGSHKA